MEKLIIVVMLTVVTLLFEYITYINLFCPELKKEIRESIEERMVRFLNLFSDIFKRG